MEFKTILLTKKNIWVNILSAVVVVAAIVATPATGGASLVCAGAFLIVVNTDGIDDIGDSDY